MNHTPGPWYVGAQNDALYIIDQPPRPSNDDINPDANTNPIAKVYVAPDRRHETEAANARILAKAPEMLDTLKFALEVIGRQTQFYAEDALFARLALDIEAVVAATEGRGQS